MQQIPLESRPRERLKTDGPDGLSNAELLAIILGSGTKGKSVLELSNELLSEFSGLAGLFDASFAELSSIKGIGKAKALQLEAAFTLAKRRLLAESNEKPTIHTAEEAYKHFKPLFFGAKEEKLALLFLDAKSQLIGKEVIGIGTLTEVLIHPREVFAPVIRAKAQQFILAHNHPSGNPEPSREDIEVTKMLLEGAKLLSIALVDHIIVGKDSFFAFSEKRS